jgi:hypothetical protein
MVAVSSHWVSQRIVAVAVAVPSRVTFAVREAGLRAPLGLTARAPEGRVGIGLTSYPGWSRPAGVTSTARATFSHPHLTAT